MRNRVLFCATIRVSRVALRLSRRCPREGRSVRYLRVHPRPLDFDSSCELLTVSVVVPRDLSAVSLSVTLTIPHSNVLSIPSLHGALICRAGQLYYHRRITTARRAHNSPEKIKS